MLTNFIFMIHPHLKKTPPIGPVKEIKVNMLFSSLYNRNSLISVGHASVATSVIMSGEVGL